jgi:hypothetical protein
VPTGVKVEPHEDKPEGAVATAGLGMEDVSTDLEDQIRDDCDGKYSFHLRCLF